MEVIQMIKPATATEQLLRCIAQHLSGRHDCREIQYRVTISEDIEQNCIHVEMDPVIKVFPNRYHRKLSDKQSVVSHVLCTHFRELIESNCQDSYRVSINQLVPGEYQYQLSIDHKYRRWTRIK